MKGSLIENLGKYDKKIVKREHYPSLENYNVFTEKNSDTKKSKNYDLDYYMNNTSIFNRSPKKDLEQNLKRISSLDRSNNIDDFLKDWNQILFFHKSSEFKDEDMQRIFQIKLRNVKQKDRYFISKDKFPSNLG
jgi:hypothetical protein